MQCVEDDDNIWPTDAKDVASIQVPEWDLQPGDEAQRDMDSYWGSYMIRIEPMIPK